MGCGSEVDVVVGSVVRGVGADPNCTFVGGTRKPKWGERRPTLVFGIELGEASRTR